MLSRSLSSIYFKFVNQNYNMAADTLAKAALFSASNSPNGNVNSGSDYVSKKNGLTQKKVHVSPCFRCVFNINFFIKHVSNIFCITMQLLSVIS